MFIRDKSIGIDTRSSALLRAESDCLRDAMFIVTVKKVILNWLRVDACAPLVNIMNSVFQKGEFYDICVYLCF